MPEIHGESVLVAVPDEPMEVLLYPALAALANGGASERFRGGVAAGSLLTG
jgi:hypothetical protein